MPEAFRTPWQQAIHSAQVFGSSLKSLMDRINNANVSLRGLVSVIPEAFDPLKNIIAPEMKILTKNLAGVGNSAKKAGISFKGLMDNFAKGFGKGLLMGTLDRLGTVGAVLKPLFGVLLKDKKIKKSADASKGMFGAMQKAGSAAALGIIGFLDKIGVIGMVLKPFEPILTIIGGLLKTFLAPVIIAVTNALQPLYKWLMGLMPIFQELGEKLAPIIAQIFSVLIEVFMEFTPIIEAILPIIAKLAGIFLENKIIMDILLIPLKFLAFILKVVVGWLVGHSPGLIPALETIAEIVQMLVEGSLAIFTEILEFLGETMENIAELIQIVADVFLAIGDLINDLILGVLESFNAALEILGSIIQALIDGSITILTSVFNFLGRVMNNVSKIIQSLTNIITKLISGALNILITVFKFLGDVMKNVTEILKVITGAFQWLGNLVKDIILGVLNAFTEMLKVLRDIIKAILGPLDNFIGLIRDVMGAIGGGGNIGKSIGKIFGIQHGGLVEPPGGVYNIAEAGKSEHVIPDEPLAEYFEGLQYSLEDKLETLIILQSKKIEDDRWRDGWK